MNEVGNATSFVFPYLFSSCNGVAQTVGTETTTYVIDIATPLTMVLAETTGTETIRYLHGLGLVAQSDGTNHEYFITDGLGSVRQMVGTTGSVLLAQTFDPYGNPYTSAGVEESAYGWAGEQRDGNGLMFLRARYYNAQQGRFFQMDPSRQEMDPYLYAMGNPVNRTDPSGLCSDSDQYCQHLAKDLEFLYWFDSYWPGRQAGHLPLVEYFIGHKNSLLARMQDIVTRETVKRCGSSK